MGTFAILLVLGAIIYLVFRYKWPSRQQISTDYLPETFIVLAIETTGLDAT